MLTAAVIAAAWAAVVVLLLALGRAAALGDAQARHAQTLLSLDEAAGRLDDVPTHRPQETV